MHRYRRTAVLAFCTLLVLPGCAVRGVPASPDLPHPTATAWNAPADGVVSGASQDLSRWWEQLDDPVLTVLVVRAMAGSIDIRIAEARLRQSRAEREVARASLLPTLQGVVSASDRRGGAATLAPGIDASWEPDLFGRNRRGVDAATADMAASAEDLHGARVSLAAEVGLAYVELRTLQARLEIAHGNDVSQTETMSLTEFRAQAGLVSSVDVEQARANLAQTRAQVPSLESSIAQTIHGLSTLAGLEPAALMATLGTAAPLPSVPAQIAVAIPAEMLRQRPDVRGAERRVVAETARVAVRQASRYPQFTLSGSLGANLVAGAATGGASLVASAAASLAQTLFDGGRLRQQVAIQTAVQEQAVASYESAVLLALQDVENALVAFESARRRALSLDVAAEAAANAAQLARSQYTAGLADFQTVLDTERTVLSIHDSLASTHGDRVTALIQLYKALGGGWDVVPPASARRQIP